MNKRVIATAVTVAALSLGSVSGAVANDGKNQRAAGLTNVLENLVSKGTLTQAQVDEILKALGDARANLKSAHQVARAAYLNVVTETLGITESELATRLRAGESLATIAGSKRDVLISALSALYVEQIDEAVTTGKLTSEQASKMKANINSRVASMVDRIKGERAKFEKGQRLRDKLGNRDKRGFGQGPRA